MYKNGWRRADPLPLSTGAQSSQADNRKRRLATRKIWKLRKRSADITTPDISSDATDSTSTPRRSTRRLSTLYNPIPCRQNQHRQQQSDQEFAHPSVEAPAHHHGYKAALDRSKFKHAQITLPCAQGSSITLTRHWSWRKQAYRQWPLYLMHKLVGKDYCILCTSL